MAGLRKSAKNSARPALFRGEFPPPPSPELDDLWRRHLNHRDPAAEADLVKLFAPLAWMVAIIMKRRRPLLCTDDVDELASDGLLGLLHALRACTSRETFYRYANKAIRGRIFREQVFRRGFTLRAHREKGILTAARGQLVEEHGRVPTPQEMADRVAGIIDNPNIQIGDRPQATTLNFSELRSADNHHDASARPRTFADDRAESPDAALLRREAGQASRETMKLALKGLSGTDRKIFKLLLQGVIPAEVARRMNLSRERIRQRMNGVLWEVRQRADLAERVGAEPATPLNSKSWRQIKTHLLAG
jgi:RNA polymerase sigma factor (sigma-70 family)